MKRVLVVVGIITIMVFTLSSFSVLRSRIVSLENKVQALETQLKVCQAIKEYSSIQLQSLLQKSNMNKNWQKKEFNGIPYYVVPMHHIPKNSL